MMPGEDILFQYGLAGVMLAFFMTGAVWVGKKLVTVIENNTKALTLFLHNVGEHINISTS